MEDRPHHTAPGGHKRTGRSSMQTQIGRGRSPEPGRGQAQRLPRTDDSEDERSAQAEPGGSSRVQERPESIQGITHGPEGASSEKQRIPGDPDNDTDFDFDLGSRDESCGEDSEWDDNEPKGQRTHKDDSSNPREDDTTQYNEFLRSSGDGRRTITTQRSFPVSEGSVEAVSFTKSLEDLVACLRRSKTDWVSIDCLGRTWDMEGERKIRTTVMVTFSRYPDHAEDLRRDLRMAIKDSDLPIEFVEGRVARYATNPFGLLKPQAPLVCGSSCAPYGAKIAGTIGGFVTIVGDPDPSAVYAVTCHHVVAGEDNNSHEIPWMRGQNMEVHLGMTEQQSEDLADLGLNRYRREGIERILTCLDSLNPPPRRTYGADRESYIHHFVRQFLHRWNQQYADSRFTIQDQTRIHDSIDRKFSRFNVPDQRTDQRRIYLRNIRTHKLEDFEGHIMDDMRSFLDIHYYELHIALRIISQLPHGRVQDGIEVFKDLIRIRRLWRNPPNLSKIIQHPAQIDLDSVAEDLVRSRDRTATEVPSHPNHQDDIQQLTQELERIGAWATSNERLIGTVWASSGIRGKEWGQETSPPLHEDWALIKLFGNNAQAVQNTFKANLLRPGFPEDRFERVRELLHPTRIDVTKRGRTTDLTVGKVNGVTSVFKDGDHERTVFGVITTSMNKQFFSLPGDSGSWIADRAGRLVGMMWGGHTSFRSRRDKVEVTELYQPHDLEVRDVTYFTPASYLFNWIERSFEEAMTRFGQSLDTDAVEGRVRFW